MLKAKTAFADNHVFVNGNTKSLKDCNDDDIAILISNGKGDLFEEKTEQIENPVAAEDIVQVQGNGSAKKNLLAKGKDEATGVAAE